MTRPRMKMAKDGRQPTMIAKIVSICHVGDFCRKHSFSTGARTDSSLDPSPLWEKVSLCTSKRLKSTRRRTSMSHVVLTCPDDTLDSNETLRIMAVAMVRMPTRKTTPILIFSTGEILKFQMTRTGTAMTISCQFITVQLENAPSQTYSTGRSPSLRRG